MQRKHKQKKKMLTRLSASKQIAWSDRRTAYQMISNGLYHPNLLYHKGETNGNKNLHSNA